MEDIYKVVLVGESGVGKREIICQYVHDDIQENMSSQFVRKTLEFPDGKSVTFDIWDTVGQEKYRDTAKIYYKDAKAVIMVYDITCEKSFTEIKNYWYPEIKKLSRKDVILAIAANRSELYHEETVNNNEAKEFAKEIGAIFMNTSKLSDIGVKSLFENIGRKILDPTFDFFAAQQKEDEEQKRKYEEKKKLKELNRKALDKKNKKECSIF